MTFNSFEYVLFLLVTLAIYHQLAQRAQNWLLLAASYFFYAQWDPRFLSLIVLSTVVDYIAGLQIDRSPSLRRRKMWLWLSVTVNLGILFTFKYFDFFAESLADLAAVCGWTISADSVFLRFTLPVGISFYTFQTMSYTIDIYRGQLRPTSSFLNFAVFVAFFPQLVAGPIERASRLLPQVESLRRLRAEDVTAGVWLIFFGLFKKVVVADNFGRLASLVFDAPGNARGLDVLLGVWAFAWQIYGDFSGYSDIARGSARLLGFDLMQNFRRPYFASNPQEFWSRWHISLSTWLRDYLYIPLGGNRAGRAQVYRNLTLTMILGGIWHGAAWHFVAWGLYQGLLLVGHRLLCGRVPAAERREQGWNGLRVLKVILFFQFASAGWLLFRVNRLSDLAVLGSRVWSDGTTLWMPFCATAVLALPLLMLHLFQEFHEASQSQPADSGEWVVHGWGLGRRVGVYAVLAAAILVFGVRDGSQFIYFQF